MTAPRSLAARLADIQDAIQRIRRYTTGKDIAAFRSDEYLRDAVERCIEIISEASRQIPGEMKSRHPEVPWQDIAGIGNILRHDYSRVEPRIIWNVAARHLDSLEQAIVSMLRSSQKP